jgi:antitoxin CcdA
MRMNAESPANRPRRATNISLDAELIETAKSLGINISRTCERALKGEVAEATRAQWLEENREAIEASNAWVREHGLPLAQYRRF